MGQGPNIPILPAPARFDQCRLHTKRLNFIHQALHQALHGVLRCAIGTQPGNPTKPSNGGEDDISPVLSFAEVGEALLDDVEVAKDVCVKLSADV